MKPTDSTTVIFLSAMKRKGKKCLLVAEGVSYSRFACTPLIGHASLQGDEAWFPQEERLMSRWPITPFFSAKDGPQAFFPGPIDRNPCLVGLNPLLPIIHRYRLQALRLPLKTQGTPQPDRQNVRRGGRQRTVPHHLGRPLICWAVGTPEEQCHRSTTLFYSSVM